VADGQLGEVDIRGAGRLAVVARLEESVDVLLVAGNGHVLPGSAIKGHRQLVARIGELIAE